MVLLNQGVEWRQGGTPGAGCASTLPRGPLPATVGPRVTLYRVAVPNQPGPQHIGAGGGGARRVGAASDGGGCRAAQDPAVQVTACRHHPARPPARLSVHQSTAQISHLDRKAAPAPRPPSPAASQDENSRFSRENCPCDGFPALSGNCFICFFAFFCADVRCGCDLVRLLGTQVDQ